MELVIKPEHYSKLFSLGFHPWLEWNLTTPMVGKTQPNWSLVSGIAIYDLWKDMNDFVFNKSTSLGYNLLAHILQQATFIETQQDSPSVRCVQPQQRVFDTYFSGSSFSRMVENKYQ